MHIRCGRATDVGMVRKENQDALGMLPEGATTLADPRGVLFIVADGMGGLRAGRRASELALATIMSAFSPVDADGIPAALSSALIEANRRVFDEGSSTPAYNGMGTTCTALAVQGNSAWIAHVGDSKIFRITPGGIAQITTDHSRVWELYARGIITREQARVNPERNLLTRALGQLPEISADLSGPLPLQPGVRFVLCTDGLTNHVEESEVKEIVLRSPPEAAASELVALANTRGGSDNITVQIVEVLGG